MPAARRSEIVFVATYRPATADADSSAQVGSRDAEMDARVARHRAERPSAWRTLEAPAKIAESVSALSPQARGVIVDCLTLWISDRLDQDDASILRDWKNELAGLKQLGVPVIVVGNEVGWSLVPADPLMRRFRDLTGLLSQITAAASERASLMVAGYEIILKGN